MIFTYNKEHVGDVLMVIVAEAKGQPVQFERKGQVACFPRGNRKTVAWNIFEASSLVEMAGNGQVFLTDEQVATLNLNWLRKVLLKAWLTIMLQSS